MMHSGHLTIAIGELLFRTDLSHLGDAEYVDKVRYAVNSENTINNCMLGELGLRYAWETLSQLHRKASKGLDIHPIYFYKAQLRIDAMATLLTLHNAVRDDEANGAVYTNGEKT